MGLLDGSGWLVPCGPDSCLGVFNRRRSSREIPSHIAGFALGPSFALHAVGYDAKGRANPFLGIQTRGVDELSQCGALCGLRLVSLRHHFENHLRPVQARGLVLRGGPRALLNDAFFLLHRAAIEHTGSALGHGHPRLLGAHEGDLHLCLRPPLAHTFLDILLRQLRVEHLHEADHEHRRGRRQGSLRAGERHGLAPPQRAQESL
mmetsp:Transcript_92423/g.232456  ORF Transcript_92423/g.232456 Transcript_92423/m.232456 type:complete len:205 (-) Transcript_92423:757-1371(-)